MVRQHHSISTVPLSTREKLQVRFSSEGKRRAIPKYLHFLRDVFGILLDSLSRHHVSPGQHGSRQAACHYVELISTAQP